MSYLALFLIWMLANLVIAPWVLERTRKEMDSAARRDAPGGFAELPSGLTHYQWHGVGRGPVVVMVHGLTSPSWVFQALIPHLTRFGFHILTYDLYGRGYSDRVAGAQDESFHVAQLEELLDALDIADQEISLFGYSMGGSIATAYAARHPEQIDRLMLLAPAGMHYHPGPLLNWVRDKGRLGDWLWGALGAWQLRRTALAETDEVAIHDLPERMVAETQNRGYLRAILSSERHMLSQSQEANHRAIAKTPIAVISVWGEEDSVIPLSSIGKLTEWNRRAYKYQIAGAGHGIGYSHPDAVAMALQEHLREV
ncbi:alpha/beta fold hydrolase [Aliiroseovarius lamellibrachiae]|uniref:alpha/beta fold hydrolase n=1 Tax=Aliiroseovarius lamellibrachiae TaxID=1924933 RepID=UPI001BE05FEE|nr:alpha/beta hydrolase [Aliiroseovarius lamellibrachiae]MBT2131477.1 alpha/beta hydrolase [Aliiroseovarius lamellibrachiae]